MVQGSKGNFAVAETLQLEQSISQTDILSWRVKGAEKTKIKRRKLYHMPLSNGNMGHGSKGSLAELVVYKNNLSTEQAFLIG